MIPIQVQPLQILVYLSQFDAEEILAKESISKLMDKYKYQNHNKIIRRCMY